MSSKSFTEEYEPSEPHCAPDCGRLNDGGAECTCGIDCECMECAYWPCCYGGCEIDG